MQALVLAEGRTCLLERDLILTTVSPPERTDNDGSGMGGPHFDHNGLVKHASCFLFKPKPHVRAEDGFWAGGGGH